MHDLKNQICGLRPNQESRNRHLKMITKAIAITIADNGRKTKVNSNPKKLGEATILQIP